MNLAKRNRILRASPAIRAMVAENALQPSDLIAPLFVVEGKGIREEIASMPGYFRNSVDLILKEVRELHGLGIPAVLLFVKVPEKLKDNRGKEAVNPGGLMQRTVRAIKEALPEMVVMTDVALDPYSLHGHDGIVEDQQILNDETVEVLVEMSLTHAIAGADFVAPSDMMDGRIGAIRAALEQHHHHGTGIMSYAAKYASCFYGPFRDALDSAPGFGDKKTYQMDYSNSREALLEVSQDIDEGADIIMIKPALPYLDVISKVRQKFQVPISAYQVSGEYSMIKAAGQKGWMDESRAILESLTCIKRAGADLIATYFAKAAAHLIRDGKS